MLTVISPAKRLDFGPGDEKLTPTWPDRQADAVSLAHTARRLSVARLQKLMSISKALAKLNQDRFKAFQEDPGEDETKPAALIFAGDTYIGLEAASLDADEMAYAQDHLRILSGLYGLLRPMDRIQPYRLEMGSRLATRRGRSLYKYWGDRLANELDDIAATTGARTLVNCASHEYFSAVPLKALKLPVVTPVFMELQGDQRSVVGFFAKKARGAMARFIVQKRIDQVAGLKDFDFGGYGFKPKLSDESQLVFVRDYPEAA